MFTSARLAAWTEAGRRCQDAAACDWPAVSIKATRRIAEESGRRGNANSSKRPLASSQTGRVSDVPRRVARQSKSESIVAPVDWSHQSSAKARPQALAHCPFLRQPTSHTVALDHVRAS